MIRKALKKGVDALRAAKRRLATRRKRSQDRVSGGPSQATVVVEGRCNLSCRMCIYHSREIPRPRTVFSVGFDDFKRVIDILVEHGLKSCNICGTGEVFLNKDIFRMIRYCKERGLFTSLLSNGSKVISDKLEKIVDSGLDLFKADFDSGDPAQIEHIKRGIRYDDLVSNLRRLLELRGKRGSAMGVQLDSIVMKYNFMHLKKLFETAAELGVDRVCLSYLVPVSETHELMSARNSIRLEDAAERASIDEAVRYGRGLGLSISCPRVYEADFSGKLECSALWDKAMVNLPIPGLPKEDWIGNMSMFCKLCATRYGDSFGNILKQPFDEVWNGDKIRDLRRRLRTGKGVPRVCAEECPCYADPEGDVDPRGKDAEDDWLRA